MQLKIIPKTYQIKNSHHNQNAQINQKNLKYISSAFQEKTNRAM